MAPPAAQPSDAPPAQQFKFRYALFTVAVDIEGERLVIRMGLRTAVTTLPRLQHLYVFDGPERSERELLLSYATPRGRLKRIRVYAERGEPRFDHLVEALVAHRPDIDIRHLSAAEATARSESRPLEWFALPLMMALSLLFVAGVFWPLLRHGVDRGHAELTVRALHEGAAPGTRNLVLSGRLLPEYVVRKQVSADEQLGHITSWLPLVEPDWQPGDPVRVILQASTPHDAPLAQLAERGAWPGILRTVAWEGLGRAQRAQLLDAGAPLAERVLLFEYNAQPQHDLGAALVILGPLSLVMAGLSLYLYRRRSDRPPPARAALAGRPTLDDDDEDEGEAS